MKIIEIIEDDYRGEHESPDKESGAPLFNVCLNGIYPNDFYGSNGFRYYADTGEAADQQSFNIVQSYHNKPNAPIKIYRAVPTYIAGVDIKKINPSDWVAICRRYAVEHGRDNLKNSYRIITRTVFARDLFTDGNISEWGYYPQPRDETMTIERNRRRLLMATMSDEEKQAYTQERARHGKTTTPDEWNEIFKTATKDRPPSTSL